MKQFTLILLTFTLLLTSCKPASDPGDDAANMQLRPNSNRVVTVSYPLCYFATRLLSDTPITVEFPGDSAENPGTWQPPAADIAAMQSADLVIANGPGAPYAQWLNRVSLSKSKLCNSTEVLPTADFVLVADHKVVHRHGPEGEHSHPYMVPYSWMDPAIAGKQSQRIATALQRIYPEHAETITRNLAALEKDLRGLSEKLGAIGARNDGLKTTILSANPNLKFFTRAAGVEDLHMLWLDEIPDNPVEAINERLAALKSRGATEEQGSVTESETETDRAVANVILWPASLKKIWSPGHPSVGEYDAVVIDLLDHSPSEGDYLSVMEANIRALSEKLADE